MSAAAALAALRPRARSASTIVAADRARARCSRRCSRRTIQTSRTCSRLLLPPAWAKGGDAAFPLGTD